MSEFHQVLLERTSAEHFDASEAIPKDVVRELIAAATQAPSAFNIQHWRFLAITDKDIKARLKDATIAPNQERVLLAPLLLLVLGDTEGHRELGPILEESMAAGTLSSEIAQTWLTMATHMYGADATLAREEAIRSCALAGMALLFAAQEKGYATCPIGFNAGQVSEILAIRERYVPVLMIVVGRGAAGNAGRRPRLPVDRVLAFNSPETF